MHVREGIIKSRKFLSMWEGWEPKNRGVAWSGGGQPLSCNWKDGPGADTGIFLVLEIQTHYCYLNYFNSLPH